MALLNLRSLRKHSYDILIDTYLLNKDELCLSKTQLHLDENNIKISKQLENIFLDEIIKKYDSWATKFIIFLLEESHTVD